VSKKRKKIHKTPVSGAIVSSVKLSTQSTSLTFKLQYIRRGKLNFEPHVLTVPQTQKYMVIKSITQVYHCLKKTSILMGTRTHKIPISSSD